MYLQETRVTPDAVIAQYARTEVDEDVGLVRTMTPLATIVASRHARTSEGNIRLELPTLSEIAVYGSGERGVEDGGLNVVDMPRIVEAETPEELAIRSKRVWLELIDQHGEVCRAKLDLQEKDPPAIGKLALPLSVYEDLGLDGFVGYFAWPHEIEAFDVIARAIPLALHHDPSTLPQQDRYL